MSKFKKTIAASIAVASIMSTVATTAYAEQSGTEFITSMITENLKKVDLDGINIDSDIKAIKVIGDLKITDKGMQTLSDNGYAKAVSVKVGFQSLTNNEGDVACQIQARLNGTDVLKATSVIDVDKSDVYLAIPGYMKGVAKMNVEIENVGANPITGFEKLIKEEIPNKLAANEENMKVNTDSKGYSLVCTDPEDGSKVIITTDKSYTITDIDVMDKTEGYSCMMDFADNAWCVNYGSTSDNSEVKTLTIEGADGKATCIVNETCGFDVVYSVPSEKTLNTWEMTFNNSEEFFELMGYDAETFGKISKIKGQYAYNSKTFIAEESAYFDDGSEIFTSKVSVNTSKKTVDFKIPAKAKDYEDFESMLSTVDVSGLLTEVTEALS